MTKGKSERKMFGWILMLILCAGLAFPVSAKAATLRAYLKISNSVLVKKGTTLTMTASSKGGSGDISYKFGYSYNGGSAKTIQKYSSKNTCKFKPSRIGNYKLIVYAKDEAGKTSKKTIKIRVRAVRSASETAARNKVISTAKAWLGIREYSSAHQSIINYYNSITNNTYSRTSYGSFGHFTMTTSYAWCDTFVSAVFAKARLNKIAGAECSCGFHVALLQRMGIWVEDDSYIPAKGDIIFYDWTDSGSGDCTGWPDHVGIVVSVSSTSKIKIIEGNYKDSVTYRTISIDSRYIRGYGTPNYASA